MIRALPVSRIVVKRASSVVKPFEIDILNFPKKWVVSSSTAMPKTMVVGASNGMKTYVETSTT